jgi:hypothetical protein
MDAIRTVEGGGRDLSALILPFLIWAGAADSIAASVDTSYVPEPADTSYAPEPYAAVADSAQSPWAITASATSYFGTTVDLYVVPDVSLEYHGLHLEGRYNYEDLHTGSMFLGWHFGWGDEDSGLDLTPMAGWVTGRTEGFAPAVLLDARLGRFQLYNEFEYVFTKDDESFVYDRTDLIYALSGPLFIGIVGEHSLSTSDREFVPGFLVGASSSRFGMTFYLFQPGQEDAKGGLELELEY